MCSNCGLGEGSLTTDCPGTQQDYETTDAIYNGTLDFLAGRWVESCSPYCPKGLQSDIA